MLKRPRVGQIVATIAKCDCYLHRHPDGVVGRIKKIDPPPGEGKARGILIVTSPANNRWHCTKCLRLLTPKERRSLKKGEIL